MNHPNSLGLFWFLDQFDPEVPSETIRTLAEPSSRGSGRRPSLPVPNCRREPTTRRVSEEENLLSVYLDSFRPNFEYE